MSQDSAGFGQYKREVNIMSGKFMKAGEVAEMFDIALMTVYRLAKEGLLPSIKIGRAVRFSEEEMEQIALNVAVRMGEDATVPAGV